MPNAWTDRKPASRPAGPAASVVTGIGRRRIFLSSSNEVIMRGTLAIASALCLALVGCALDQAKLPGGDYYAPPYVNAANIDQFLALYGYTQVTGLHELRPGWVSGGWAGSAIDSNGRAVAFLIDPYDIIHTTPK